MSDKSGARRWRTQAKLELGHCYIPSRERRQTGKKADHIGERTEKLSFSERTNLPYRPPYSLSIKKSLREARRAKPLMSWRRLYLRKSARLRFRMCYILSIERQLLRKAFIPLWKKKKKNSARERPMEREKVAEVLLDFMEWNKAEFRTTLSISCFHRKKEFRRWNPDYITAGQNWIWKSKPEMKSVEIINFHPNLIYWKRGPYWSPEDIFRRNWHNYYREDWAAKIYFNQFFGLEDKTVHRKKK